MNKIWMVTEGSYDDYGVVALYTSKEVADEHAGLRDDGQVEEWDVDTVPIPRVVTYWVAYVYWNEVMGSHSPETMELSRLQYGDDQSWLASGGGFHLDKARFVYGLDPVDMKDADGRWKVIIRYSGSAFSLTSADEALELALSKMHEDLLEKGYKP